VLLFAYPGTSREATGTGATVKRISESFFSNAGAKAKDWQICANPNEFTPRKSRECSLA
jgi:hypothetical protein